MFRTQVMIQAWYEYAEKRNGLDKAKRDWYANETDWTRRDKLDTRSSKLIRTEDDWNQFLSDTWSCLNSPATSHYLSHNFLGTARSQPTQIHPEYSQNTTDIPQPYYQEHPSQTQLWVYPYPQIPSPILTWFSTKANHCTPELIYSSDYTFIHF
jgi:hypothetical protein